MTLTGALFMKNMGAITAKQMIYVELEDGREVGWMYEATQVTDNHYGADADGRGGAKYVAIEDIAPVGKIADLLKHDINGNPLLPNEVPQIIELLNQKAEKSDDWDFEQYDPRTEPEWRRER